MLEVADLEVSYGDLQVLWGVSLNVKEGEIVCLLGPNGSGKSTTMNTISGLVHARSGSIRFCGERIDNTPPHTKPEKGLAHVLERRRIFPYLTVKENLQLGAHNYRARQSRDETIQWVFELFPILRERQRQLGRTLSGGEQQMLAIGRGLMAKPRFIMIDEPFLGLTPLMVKNLSGTLQRINAEGVTVLVIEQNVRQALAFANRAYILDAGNVVIEGRGEDLSRSEEIRRLYLGL